MKGLTEEERAVLELLSGMSGPPREADEDDRRVAAAMVERGLARVEVVPDWEDPAGVVSVWSITEMGRLILKVHASIAA